MWVSLESSLALVESAYFAKVDKRLDREKKRMQFSGGSSQFASGHLDTLRATKIYERAIQS